MVSPQDAYFAVLGTTKQFTCLARRTYRDSPDERELGRRRSASRGNGRPKGQPFSASSINRSRRHKGDHGLSIPAARGLGRKPCKTAIIVADASGDGSSTPARPRSEYRVVSRLPSFRVRGRLTIRGGDGDVLTCSSRGKSAWPDFAPQTQLLPAVLYDAPLHGAVMAHGMTGPHHSRRPINLRGGIGIGSLRPVARPRGHDVPGPRHAVVIFRPGRKAS